MPYLLAKCPMYGCNHKNVVCMLPSEAVPEFEPSVYVAVKCSNCGQVFREVADRLEFARYPAAKVLRQEERA
jgi:transcription elongation factor Elf1